MNPNNSPVFASPDSPGDLRTAKRPVDLVFLAKQTGGDRALEEEVLLMFSKQASALGKDLRGQRDSEVRRRNAHTLKGAARAVGAFDLAECASVIETNPGDRSSVTALLREVETVRDYIASLLR
jgi:HPt (histidine-containing phosphotransfer) domain-containing protein